MGLLVGSWSFRYLSLGSQLRHLALKYLLIQPDRGFNVDGTVNYQGRRHNVEFTLSPYYGAANLTFAAAQKTLELKYQNTVLWFERNHKQTTGLDALGVRAKEFGYPLLVEADPQLPVSIHNDLLLDAEGLVMNADGS